MDFPCTCTVYDNSTFLVRECYQQITDFGFNSYCFFAVKKSEPVNLFVVKIRLALLLQIARIRLKHFCLERNNDWSQVESQDDGRLRRLKILNRKISFHLACLVI